MEISQDVLNALPVQQRQKLVKQLRQEQVTVNSLCNLYNNNKHDI